jgi:hypothetical protein
MRRAVVEGITLEREVSGTGAPVVSVASIHPTGRTSPP